MQCTHRHKTFTKSPFNNKFDHSIGLVIHDIDLEIKKKNTLFCLVKLMGLILSADHKYKRSE